MLRLLFERERALEQETIAVLRLAREGRWSGGGVSNTYQRGSEVCGSVGSGLSGVHVGMGQAFCQDTDGETEVSVEQNSVYLQYFKVQGEYSVVVTVSNGCGMHSAETNDR